MSRDRVAELLSHLEATEELPLREEANRWIGEAEAVAADLVDAPDDVVGRRIEHVSELLSHVEETGHPAADEHVVDARALAERLSNEDGPA
ncbi:hypothetical protein [Natronorarus salvus]|uniref:hypothetical protein n=1 Tax=Natronorarus salvus TaxID=3117733 RepID=UPI002F269529